MRKNKRKIKSLEDVMREALEKDARERNPYDVTPKRGSATAWLWVVAGIAVAVLIAFEVLKWKGF